MKKLCSIVYLLLHLLISLPSYATLSYSMKVGEVSVGQEHYELDFFSTRNKFRTFLIENPSHALRISAIDNEIMRITRASKNTETTFAPDECEQAKKLNFYDLKRTVNCITKGLYPEKSEFHNSAGVFILIKTDGEKDQVIATSELRNFRHDGRSFFILENIVAPHFKGENTKGAGMVMMKLGLSFISCRLHQTHIYLDYQNSHVKTYYEKSLNLTQGSIMSGYEDHRFLEGEYNQIPGAPDCPTPKQAE